MLLARKKKKSHEQANQFDPLVKVLAHLLHVVNSPEENIEVKNKIAAETLSMNRILGKLQQEESEVIDGNDPRRPASANAAVRSSKNARIPSVQFLESRSLANEEKSEKDIEVVNKVDDVISISIEPGNIKFVVVSSLHF